MESTTAKIIAIPRLTDSVIGLDCSNCGIGARRQIQRGIKSVKLIAYTSRR